MEKIKEKLNYIFYTIKNVFKVFPITTISIILLTFLYAFDIDGNILGIETLNKILLFGFLFIIGSLLVETVFRGKRKRILGYIISAIMAFVFTSDEIRSILSNNIKIFMDNLLYFYIISTCVITIYFNYKKSGKSFEKYLLSVFSNFSKTFLIYGIIAVGSTTLTIIFIYLILDQSSYTLLGRIEVLIVGIYLLPMLIYYLYNVDESISKFMKIVIKYVLGILVIIAFSIIYLYIFKIIIFMDMPSNQVFRILASLFIFGCLIWTLVENLDEGKLIDKINRLLPKLFIPFIFLQIYAIGIRIVNNGITEPRYLCLMLIIFEIIYIVIYLKKKEKIGELLLVFVILAAISTIVPVINMHDISRLSQYNNLKIYVNKSNYTQEDKNKIYGAYNYLKGIEGGQILIDNLLSKEDQNEISTYSYNNYSDKEEYNRSIYVESGCNELALDIGKYNKLYTFNISDNKKDMGNVDKNFNNFVIKFNKDKEEIVVNITKNIKEYISYGDNLDEVFDKINRIKISENDEIIINHVSILYNKDNENKSENLGYYQVSGYLLRK